MTLLQAATKSRTNAPFPDQARCRVAELVDLDAAGKASPVPRPVTVSNPGYQQVACHAPSFGHPQPGTAKHER
jgi:hypothetical protein